MIENMLSLPHTNYALIRIRENGLNLFMIKPFWTAGENAEQTGK